MGTALFAICLCLFGSANAAIKPLDCRIKEFSSFGNINTNVTMCVFDNAKFVPGKNLKFSDATKKYTSKTIRVKFNESSIQAIPNSLFEEFQQLEILELNYVGLRNIYPSSFVGAEYLKVLQAFSNKMTTLNGYAFFGANNLEILDLSSNMLMNINGDTFAGLDKLSELSLSSNRISILDEATFLPLKNLAWIWLDRNQIKIIAANLLIGNQKLQGIFAGGNKISALSPILFEKLPALKFLFLTGNNCTSSNFVNTQVSVNANVKKELSSCFAEFRTIVPDEDDKFSLKGVLRDAEKANSACESDKATLLERLETARQQLAKLQGKNRK